MQQIAESYQLNCPFIVPQLIKPQRRDARMLGLGIASFAQFAQRVLASCIKERGSLDGGSELR